MVAEIQMPRMQLLLLVGVAVFVCSFGLLVGSLLGFWKDAYAVRRETHARLIYPYTEPRCGLIPKNIHFIAADDPEVGDEIVVPDTIVKSWHQRNPGWDVHIWQKTTLDSVFRAIGGQTKKNWEDIQKLPDAILRSDMTRYEVLNETILYFHHDQCIMHFLHY